MTNGFIQLHRRLIEWEWYTDQKTFKLFLHCLLRANHKPNNWRGHHIKRGQFITSLKKLSDETGLTVKQVRLALDNLILTKELGKETTSQNTIITVLSYDIYQDNGKQEDKLRANERQTNGKRRATNNNDNKENKEINISFDEFWSSYDHKVGNKSKCEKKWISLKDSEREKIMQTLPTFLSRITDKQFQPHPLTYLNNERWNDEISETPKLTYISLPNLYANYMLEHKLDRLPPEKELEIKQLWETKYKPLI